MAAKYRLTLTRRLLNALIRPLVRLGLGGKHTYLLTVTGRRTGRRYTTPVTLVENGERWLVAPYGERDRVKNARAAGWVELSRAGRNERLAIEEVGAEESAAVLHEYVRRVPATRPYFDTDHDVPAEAFAAEAASHPVFRLLPPRTGARPGAG